LVDLTLEVDISATVFRFLTTSLTPQMWISSTDIPKE